MNYREIHPPPDLEHVIRFFWIAEANMRPARSLAFRIVADGCPGIIFQMSDSRYSYEKNVTSELPTLFLYGQTTRHGILRSTGKAYTIGVNFYPHALKTIFGFDADEAMDEVIDLDLLQPNLSEQMLASTKTENRINLLSTFLRNQIEQNAYFDAAVSRSVVRINETRGDISMYNLYHALQLSERQFQRRFKQHVGITPKHFARIIRFQSALDQVRSQNYQQLSDVAFDNGYSDQSHFIRDFKEFSGLNPGAYEEREMSLICRHREWNMAFN